MIKAIDTSYKGYKFRSRLEARWAIYFDAIGLEWEYEKEGFEFEDGKRYLPDFYIPDFGYIEIKGKKPNEEEKEKAKKLSLGKNCGVTILVGTPNPEGNCFICFIEGLETCKTNFSKYSVRKWGQTPYYGDYNYYNLEDIEFINKAKSARFEFN